MYISLKWKLVVFLSLVLATVTVAWTWQSVYKQLENFEDKLERGYSAQNKLIEELVSDNYLKLSQLALLIAENPTIEQRLSEHDNEEATEQALESDWLSYNINLGLDYLAVYDADKQARSEIFSSMIESDRQLSGYVARELLSRNSPHSQKNFIYCARVCLMVVLEPFITDNGTAGTIVVAQNMAELVRSYSDFSSAALGILIEDVEPLPGSSQERYLDQWHLRAWAVSDFERVFPVLEGYAQGNPHHNPRNELYHSGDASYLVKSLATSIETLGNNVYFMSISDETSDYLMMQDNIRRGLWTGMLVLLVAEGLLLLLLVAPLNRLTRITNALHLLPYQQFSRAANKLSTGRSWFPDELSTLETSTAYVATELEKLQGELTLKNKSLENQIHALTRSRAFLSRLFDNAQIFIITQDHDSRILSTNTKFEAMYQHVPDNFGVLFSDELQSDHFQEHVQRLHAREEEVFQQELRQFDKNGKEMVIAWTHTLVEDESGEEIVLSIGIDQTMQKLAEHDLRRMANHDSLTGIGNRRYFNTALAQFLNADMHGALVFIDVNRFKQINDIYGHATGDKVLVEIAQKLRTHLRNSDVICRFAGDEFIAILANTDANSLPPILDKVLENLCGSVKVASGRSVNYTVSIGASLFPAHGDDAQTLTTNADMAMYNAKRKGLGHWHIFDPDEEQVVQLKIDNSLILNIRNALRDNAFHLVYQPVVNLHTEEISHYEVLVRMLDERGETISPGLFIPVAERSGEIRRIDEWVLDNALKQFSEMRALGPCPKLAVNISAPTMQADDFPQMVIDTINKYHIDPDDLIIELTETSYIENFQQVLRNLQQVTGSGVRIALDDFGVGYSSFTHLKLLPLSYVKLDGSYIRQLQQNQEDQIFVRSLAAIVEAYGMETIAEFIEDEDTLGLLRSLGVTHGQGYYLGRPAPLVLGESHQRRSTSH
ncbi:EAL domain-containing protein [Mangrovimicrobium sediminis]|uniref:EAL domain-containing protein n=1 Tax=Mangrovimicrobium sediminis TaxID=2562682 RepID=A0A4Z0M571_9GAMM|nr:EAL domain-containing protein [Haliea sp. SAOS-164]TGD74624.1 EAL domain-containing protein [Haliea sp. SAOS-164]